MRTAIVIDMYVIIDGKMNAFGKIFLHPDENLLFDRNAVIMIFTPETIHHEQS